MNDNKLEEILPSPAILSVESINAGDYFIKDGVDLDPSYKLESMWMFRPDIDPKLIEELAGEESLEIEKFYPMREYPHLGWILLKAEECPVKVEKENSRVIVLKGAVELEEETNIRIAIVENPSEISLFICPESIGTVWELDEFREMFINFFNKYVKRLTAAYLANTFTIPKDTHSGNIGNLKIVDYPQWWEEPRMKVTSIGTSNIKCVDNSDYTIKSSIGDYITDKIKSSTRCSQ